jgi:sugar O-acyltransferase (sialic acid O-acetyltransferase NeuD family)
MNKPVILIGYGGHGLVAADILLEGGVAVEGYCDSEQKKFNPFELKYLGTETQFFSIPENALCYAAFISIGKSALRVNIFKFLEGKNVSIINAIHPKAIVSKKVDLGKGIFIAANATINTACKIGNGVICNTSSSIDHECVIGDFTHICPGVVLCGNVTIGKNSFIGANSTIIPGITIGNGITVGAGSTVINNLLLPGTYAGSPAKLLQKAN